MLLKCQRRISAGLILASFPPGRSGPATRFVIFGGGGAGFGGFGFSPKSPSAGAEKMGSGVQCFVIAG